MLRSDDEGASAARVPVNYRFPAISVTTGEEPQAAEGPYRETIRTRGRPPAGSSASAEPGRPSTPHRWVKHFQTPNAVDWPLKRRE